MFFTQEDYRKIEKWLLANSKKDTQFVEAATPLQGNETIAFVQNGKNVKTSVKDIVDQLFLLGASDFLNITDKYGEKNITINQAIQLIPYRSRKIGQVITFLDEFSEWRVYQFQGERVNQWNNTTLWIDLLQAISDSSNIVPDEEDITGVLQGGRNLLKFKDKNYNKDNYSGLGRVFLRKNPTTVTDPSTMCKISTNLLTQEMISREYTIYIIQYDYTLNGNTVVIPKGSILDFQGGSIDNGTLSFEDDTKIKEHFIGNAIIEGNPYYIDYTPDEEDITIVKDIIKFKDKEYNISEYSGLGRIYLRKNISNGKNILTQDMINKPNTRYIIQYDYDLNETNITIPENCILDFQGGTIKNGTINCNNTIINGLHIFSNVVLTGNYNEGTTHTDLFIINDDITQVLTTLLNDNFCETINVNGDFQFNPVNVNLIKNKKLNINGTITLTSTFNINRSIEINGIGVNAGIQFGKPTGGIFTESKNFEGEDLFCVTGSARKVFNNISLKSENSVAIRLSHSNSNVGALFEFNDVQFYSRNNYCIYIDNVFWVWFNRCIICSITNNNNIYIFSRGAGNSYAGLIKICDSILILGNIKIDSTVGGSLDIVDCTHESLQSGESFIEIINGKMFCVSMDNVEIADAPANVYIIDANDLNTFLVKNHRGEITFKTEKRPTNYSNDSAYRNTIYTNTGITFDDKGLNSGETSYGISTYKNIYRGYSPISIGAGYNISIGDRYANNSKYFTKKQFSFNGSKTAALLVNNTGGTVYPQLFSIGTPEEISSKTGWVVLTCMVKRKEGTVYPFSYDWSSFSLGTITGDSSFEDLNGNTSRSTPLYENYINNDSWHLAGSIIKVNKFGTYLYSNIVLLRNGEYLISKPTLKFYDDTIYTLGDVINIIKGVGYQGDKEGVGVIDNVPFKLGDVDEEITIPVGSIAHSKNNLIFGTNEGNVILKKVNPNIVSYNNKIPTNMEDYSDGDIVYIYYGNNKGLTVKDNGKFVRWDGELASNRRQGNSSERPTEITMNGYFYMDTQLNVPIWYNRNSWIEADGQPASILRMGTKAQRPNNAKAGFQYFDTVINKPIWWTGNKWIDATGADV